MRSTRYVAAPSRKSFVDSSPTDMEEEHRQKQSLTAPATQRQTAEEKREYHITFTITNILKISYTKFI